MSHRLSATSVPVIARGHLRLKLLRLIGIHLVVNGAASIWDCAVHFLCSFLEVLPGLVVFYLGQLGLDSLFCCNLISRVVGLHGHAIRHMLALIDVELSAP